MAIIDDFSFYESSDTGWPCAHTGNAADPEKEWEFHAARKMKESEEEPDMFIIIGYHKPGGQFFRYAWPKRDGQVVPLGRPPTMAEMQEFVAACLVGTDVPMAPGTMVRTDLMA